MPRKRPADKQYVTTVRLAPALRKKCLKAAKARGMLLSQFIRHAAAVIAGMVPDGGTLRILSAAEIEAIENGRHGQMAALEAYPPR